MLVIFVLLSPTVPSKPPGNVQAKSFMMPYEFDVTWDALELKYWNGIPLGYMVTLSAISVGGVKLDPSTAVKHTKKISPQLTKCSFSGMHVYYQYGIQISAYTKIGAGEKSAMKFVGKLSYFIHVDRGR